MEHVFHDGGVTSVNWLKIYNKRKRAVLIRQFQLSIHLQYTISTYLDFKRVIFLWNFKYINLFYKFVLIFERRMILAIDILNGQLICSEFD